MRHAHCYTHTMYNPVSTKTVGIQAKESIGSSEAGPTRSTPPDTGREKDMDAPKRPKTASK